MAQLDPPHSPTNPFERFDPAEVTQGIHQRFEKRARKHPQRLAVVDPACSVTYESLNGAANALARAVLRQAGSSSGQVAFVLENEHRAIQALLGILKAGKTYVPLDPSFPKARTTYMFEHSEATLMISDAAHRDLARQVAGARTPLLLMEEIDFGKSADNLDLPVDPLSPAYILYTSGSTGKPKGIVFAHRNLLHTTMCLINALHIGEGDRLTQLHSTSFAASVVDIYCSLLNGACVYPWDVKTRGVGGLAKWLIEQAVTSLQWIPTAFRQLAETLDESDRFSTVRLLVMASEPLTRREFDLYRAHFPEGCLLVNQMGTSESYNYYLFFANKTTSFEGSVVPAGFPVSEDREVLLLDEHRNEVRPGEIGEIAIRSEYMSLGYWRNPELTERVFLPDRSGSEKKIYLTGDLGRRLQDGCLQHLGRKDFQVKLRGYRIELPEVELAIKKLDGIQDVSVMARPDARGDLKLVAYYISSGGSDLSVTELRRNLEGRLPDYMIPNLFVRLQEFPMTPSGKLDRNAFPSPTNTRPLLRNELVAPRTPTEEVLVKILKEVLGHPDVGVLDNFFELGADSLQASLILHQICLRCGRDLPYSVLLQAPRIADLAVFLDGGQVETGTLPGGHRANGTCVFKQDTLLRGMFNRLLQVLALYAPGLTTWRPRLHRLRGVRIGRNVAIGISTIIETAHPELVWIGDNVAIGIRNVIIGHFSDSIDKIRADGKPTVRIENNVYIGTSVTILPNVTIGEGAVVSAGSVVNKSVPPKTMVQGNPAQPVAVCGVPLFGVKYEEFLRHLRPLDSVDRNQRTEP